MAVKNIARNSLLNYESDENNNVSIDLYSFTKMDAGHEYIVEYKIYPHPSKHQKSSGN